MAAETTPNSTAPVIDDVLLEFDVVLEVPKDSGVKYELERCGGGQTRPRVDRILSCAMTYPGNYGFIENTLADDGDCTDVLVMNEQPIQTGSVMRCRAIGMLSMEDEEGRDHKILAVPVTTVDARYRAVNDIGDVAESVLRRVEHFFEHYKKADAPARWSKVTGFRPRQDALDVMCADRMRFDTTAPRAT